MIPFLRWVRGGSGQHPSELNPTDDGDGPGRCVEGERTLLVNVLVDLCVCVLMICDISVSVGIV